MSGFTSQPYLLSKEQLLLLLVMVADVIVVGDGDSQYYLLNRRIDAFCHGVMWRNGIV